MNLTSIIRSFDSIVNYQPCIVENTEWSIGVHVH